MKNKSLDMEEIIDKALDSVSKSGEKMGMTLGSMGRTAQKIIVGVVVLLIFGAAAFIWAVIHGMAKKK